MLSLPTVFLHFPWTCRKENKHSKAAETASVSKCSSVGTVENTLTAGGEKSKLHSSSLLNGDTKYIKAACEEIHACIDYSCIPCHAVIFPSLIKGVNLQRELYIHSTYCTYITPKSHLEMYVRTYMYYLLSSNIAQIWPTDSDSMNMQVKVEPCFFKLHLYNTL